MSQSLQVKLVLMLLHDRNEKVFIVYQGLFWFTILVCYSPMEFKDLEQTQLTKSLSTGCTCELLSLIASRPFG